MRKCLRCDNCLLGQRDKFSGWDESQKHGL